MEETVVVVVQEAKMGQSIDSGWDGRCSGNPKTTTLSSVFFVSKLGVYSIHVRLTFGFPPFVVCVRNSAPQRNKEASNEKKQLKRSSFLPLVCVSFGLGSLLYSAAARRGWR